eukprot:COSAG03_NODE_2429_length_2781_cov_7.819538_4_plen_185_part_00
MTDSVELSLLRTADRGREVTHQTASPHPLDGRVKNPVTQNQIERLDFCITSVGVAGRRGARAIATRSRPIQVRVAGWERASLHATLPLCSWQRVGSSAPHSRVSTCAWSARRGAAVCRAAAHARGAFGCCGIDGGAGAGCSPCWRPRGSCCTTTLSCPGAQVVGCCRCSCWGSPARLGRHCSRT